MRNGITRNVNVILTFYLVDLFEHRNDKTLLLFYFVAIADQANTKSEIGLSVVIGPFYMNLAMILEDIGIPYIITDYMGFDWSDISRVDDKVKWKNIVEVRPPMVEFNRAVVDFFVLKGWESAVMIMPENPKDNQGDIIITCTYSCN